MWPSGRPLNYTATNVGRNGASVRPAADMYQNAAHGVVVRGTSASGTSPKTSPIAATAAVKPLR